MNYKLVYAVTAVLVGLLSFITTSSAEVLAGPKPWQLGLQPSASPTMEMIEGFHFQLVIIITLISVFVLGLLIYVAVRFREKKNPIPSKTTHNSVIEVLWTAIPVVILVVISVPSFKLLYFADRIEEADMTLKVIGNQWNWTYQYPDHGNFEFTANLLQGEDLKEAQKAADRSKEKRPVLRQLSTDNPVVLPVGKKVRLLVTATDVLHNWAISPLAVRIDTVPGRLNETWVEIKKPGTYFGFCSELCGSGHAFMPIEVHAVTQSEFEQWVKKAQKKYAKVDNITLPIAARSENTMNSINLAGGTAPQ